MCLLMRRLNEPAVQRVLLLSHRKAPLAMSLKSLLLSLLPCSLVPCSVQVSIQQLHPTAGGGGGNFGPFWAAKSADFGPSGQPKPQFWPFLGRRDPRFWSNLDH